MELFLNFSRRAFFPINTLLGFTDSDLNLCTQGTIFSLFLHVNVEETSIHACNFLVVPFSKCQ